LATSTSFTIRRSAALRRFLYMLVARWTDANAADDRVCNRSGRREPKTLAPLSSRDDMQIFGPSLAVEPAGARFQGDEKCCFATSLQALWP
jgi:hypothetical protein